MRKALSVRAPLFGSKTWAKNKKNKNSNKIQAAKITF
jgi:hypothetical protein